MPSDTAWYCNHVGFYVHADWIRREFNHSVELLNLGLGLYDSFKFKLPLSVLCWTIGLVSIGITLVCPLT
jgi:hypothetical protein